MARGRKRTSQTVASQFDQEKYNRWVSDLKDLRASLDDWKHNDMAMDSARTIASRLNSGVYYQAIDPNGRTRARGVLLSKIEKVIQEKLGRAPTQDEIDIIAAEFLTNEQEAEIA